MKRHRVVIIGGGFGGVKCAQTLRKSLTQDHCEIILFNRENHMVFHPLLAEVAGSSINHDAVAPPLRQFLNQVDCRTETVTQVDLINRRVAFERQDGQSGQLEYDQVVIACGRVVNLGAVPGMSDHAFAFKTVGDAMALRSHTIQQLEFAEVCEDVDHRRWALSFVIVGGGFSGVEVAGEINDLVRSSRRFYPHIAEDDISVTLIHSGDEILPEISPGLRDFARQKMEKAGVTVLLRSRVSAATGDGIWLQDGRQLRGATVVSAVGTSPSLLVERLNAPKTKGTLLTEADMRLQGIESAWAIGDCASIINAADGRSSPPTAQFAERQGRQVAENIVRLMRGQPTHPFAFKPLGQLCTIGRHSAVAEIFGWRVSGFLAWCMWRIVYLSKVPSWSRRLKVGADWIWDLLFPRDLVTLRIDPTERVSHAYFRKGDYVFRQGDPALNFYAVEKGEVEVIRMDSNGDQEELIAVLGPGDFFGEMALIESRMRSASVRARTDIEVTTLGAGVFSRLSKSLTPLQQRLVESFRRRSTNMAARLPDVHSVLQQKTIASLVESVPRTLYADTPLHEALGVFARDRVDVLYLVETGQRLVGVLTRSDLLRSIDAAIGLPVEQRELFTARTFMSPDPVAVTLEDSLPAVAALVWNRGLKVIPIVADGKSRQLVGCIRAESLMHTVVQHLREQRKQRGLAHACPDKMPGTCQQERLWPIGVRTGQLS